MDLRLVVLKRADLWKWLPAARSPQLMQRVLNSLPWRRPVKRKDGSVMLSPSKRLTGQQPPPIQKRVRRRGHHSTRRSKCGQMIFSENKRGMDVGGLWQASCSHLSSQPSKGSEMATPKSSHLARGSLVAPLQKPPIPFPQSPLALHLLWGKLGPLCPAETARPHARRRRTQLLSLLPGLQPATAGEGRQAGSLRGGLGGSEKGPGSRGQHS